MNRLQKKLRTAQRKYDGVIFDAEKELSGKILFPFGITWQYSDGCFMVADLEEAHNAPLDKCLSIIKEKGFLTLEEFKELTI